MFVYTLTAWYEGSELLSLIQGGRIYWHPRSSWNESNIQEFAESLEEFLTNILAFYPTSVFSEELELSLKNTESKFDAESGTWEFEAIQTSTGVTVSAITAHEMKIAELAIIVSALKAWSS